MGALSDWRGRRQQEGAFHRDLLGLLKGQAEKDINLHIEIRIIFSPKKKKKKINKHTKVFLHTLINIYIEFMFSSSFYSILVLTNFQEKKKRYK